MEINQETLKKVAQLQLQGIYYAFKTSLKTRHKHTMPIDEFICWLAISE